MSKVFLGESYTYRSQQSFTVFANKHSINVLHRYLVPIQLRTVMIWRAINFRKFLLNTNWVIMFVMYKFKHKQDATVKWEDYIKHENESLGILKYGK